MFYKYLRNTTRSWKSQTLMSIDCNVINGLGRLRNYGYCCIDSPIKSLLLKPLLELFLTHHIGKV